MIRLESICCTLNTNCACTKTAKTDRVGFLCGSFVLFLSVTVCRRLVNGWIREIIVTTGWSTRKMQLAQSAVHTLHSQIVTHIYTRTYSVTCITPSINILKKRETHTVSKKYPEGISHEGKHRMIENIVCVCETPNIFTKLRKCWGHSHWNMVVLSMCD